MVDASSPESDEYHEPASTDFLTSVDAGFALQDMISVTEISNR